jgi:hypothetical protein
MRPDATVGTDQADDGAFAGGALKEFRAYTPGLGNKGIRNTGATNFERHISSFLLRS